MSFKNNFKKARIANSLNQKQLAEKLGVKQSSISQFESGLRIPNKSLLSKISLVLNVSISELTNNDNKIGKDNLMKKIKGLSPNSLETLCTMADFLRYQEQEHKKSFNF